jgi:hypothetical protein
VVVCVLLYPLLVHGVWGMADRIRIAKVQSEYDSFAQDKAKLLQDEKDALERRLESERSDKVSEMRVMCNKMWEARIKREMQVWWELNSVVTPLLLGRGQGLCVGGVFCGQLRSDFGPGFALTPKEEQRIRQNAEEAVSKEHKGRGEAFSPLKVRPNTVAGSAVLVLMCFGRTGR